MGGVKKTKRYAGRKLWPLLILLFLVCILILVFIIRRPEERRPGTSVETGAQAGVEKHTSGEVETADFQLESSMSFDASGVPDEILEFVKKYPEAKPFAENFSKHSGKSKKIDLTGEITKGVIPLFIQWDGRWGYERYADNYLGVNGCGPTCLSMVVCGLTGGTKWNPAEVARFSQECGYYEPGAGTSWNLMTEGASQLGLQAENLGVSEENIRNNLSQDGRAIICSMCPGDFTYSGHFIVLTGLDEAGNVLVNDPNSPKNSEKHWTGDVLLPQIKGMWLFKEKEKPGVVFYVPTV